MTNETFIDRLNRVLDEAGMPDHRRRATLATICGLTEQAVHKWFTDVGRNPCARHYASIAKHFNVDLRWLITGEGTPHKLPPGFPYTAEIAAFLIKLPEQDNVEIRRTKVGNKEITFIKSTGLTLQFEKDDKKE